MQNLCMVRSQKILETLSPAQFLLGCVALFSRGYGETLTSNWSRLNALLPLVIAGSLAIMLCDHYLVAQSIASLLCSLFIWFTFHKVQNNFPDRLAIQVARNLFCGFSVLTIRTVALAGFKSHIPPVPTSPPRAIA